MYLDAVRADDIGTLISHITKNVILSTADLAGFISGKVHKFAPRQPKESYIFFRNLQMLLRQGQMASMMYQFLPQRQFRSFESMSVDAKEDVSISDVGKLVDELGFPGEKSEVNLSSLEENDDKVDKVVVPFKKKQPR